MHAGDTWVDKLATLLTKMRSVSLILCLPKMSPSSSTSTGSQIATWRRSLTWTCHEFGYDLLPPSTGKMFVWPPAFLSEPGSARYSFTPSLTTVWSIRLYTTTSLKSISQKRWIYHYMFKWSSDQFNSLDIIMWPVILRSHWSIALQLTHTVTMTISM